MNLKRQDRAKRSVHGMGGQSDIVDKLARVKLRSFDRGLKLEAWAQRPDRYRDIEALFSGRTWIARGGGMSYAAASFGGDSIVVDMRSFDRIISFDENVDEITVEAGLPLGRLLDFALSRGRWIGRLPGHPNISVGGAIAANVHGKDFLEKGTFRRAVSALLIFSPIFGWKKVSADEEPELFELTIGGFGLSGIIVLATLRLERLAGDSVWEKRRDVRSLNEACEALWERGDGWYAYSWHDAHPQRSILGRGFVFHGSVRWAGEVRTPSHVGSKLSLGLPLPLPVWGGRRTKLINEVYYRANKLASNCVVHTLADAFFPFAKLQGYFDFYGKRGLIEQQILVPKANACAFLSELEKEMLRRQPPAVLMSLKATSGERRLLRFEGEGLCVAVDMVRNADGLAFAEIVDRLTVEHEGIPSIIKDSRLPLWVVERCFPEKQEFESLRRRFDPEKSMRSELSDRLRI